MAFIFPFVRHCIKFVFTVFIWVPENVLLSLWTNEVDFLSFAQVAAGTVSDFPIQCPLDIKRNMNKVQVGLEKTLLWPGDSY